MLFETFIDLLTSIETGQFSYDNESLWLNDLKKIGMKDEDKSIFLDMIRKIFQLKALVSRAMPEGGFPLRIYSPEEQARLNSDCRGLLLHFERIGLLPPELREVVIEKVLCMPELELDENQLRVLILLVLFHQAGLDVMLSHYQALPLMQGKVVH